MSTRKANFAELQALPLASYSYASYSYASYSYLCPNACDSKIEVLKTKQNGHDICFAKCERETKN